MRTSFYWNFFSRYLDMRKAAWATWSQVLRDPARKNWGTFWRLTGKSDDLTMAHFFSLALRQGAIYR